MNQILDYTSKETTISQDVAAVTVSVVKAPADASVQADIAQAQDALVLGEGGQVEPDLGRSRATVGRWTLGGHLSGPGWNKAKGQLFFLEDTVDIDSHAKGHEAVPAKG